MSSSSAPRRQQRKFRRLTGRRGVGFAQNGPTRPGQCHSNAARSVAATGSTAIESICPRSMFTCCRRICPACASALLLRAVME